MPPGLPGPCRPPVRRAPPGRTGRYRREVAGARRWGARWRAAATSVGSTTRASTALVSTALVSTTVAVAAVTVAAMAANAARLAPCWTGGWRRDRSFAAACYSDITSIYLHRHAAFPAVPYLSYRFEYPALTGSFAYLMAAAAAGLHHLGVPTGGADLYFACSATVLACCGVGAACATARLAGMGRRDGMVVGVGLSMLAFVNWDLLAVAVTAVALLALERRRPLVAGGLLGLGTAAKLYPALVLGVAALTLVRAGRTRTAVATVATGAAAWGAVNVPFLVTPLRGGWGYFYRFSAHRPADLGTVWNLLAHALSRRAVAGGLSVTTGHWVNLAEAVALAAGLTAVAALALLARRPPPVAQLAFLAVAVFVLTSKSWSPQYALWLVPLAVAARLPRRAVAGWLLIEAACYVGIFWFLDGAVHGHGPSIGLPAMLGLAAAHLAGLTALVGMAARDALAADARSGLGPAPLLPGSRRPVGLARPTA